MGMEFDEWLEEELRRGSHQVHGLPAGAARYASLSPVAGRSPMMLGLATVAKSKVAIAATATLLAAGSGVAAKAAITGDPNPFHWGKEVREQVVKCKNNLDPDEHGVGECVSDFAKHHGQEGQEAREAHAQSESHSQAGSHSKAESHDPDAPTTGDTASETTTSTPAGQSGS
jgi:hypothetical protein